MASNTVIESKIAMERNLDRILEILTRRNDDKIKNNYYLTHGKFNFMFETPSDQFILRFYPITRDEIKEKPKLELQHRMAALYGDDNNYIGRVNNPVYNVARFTEEYDIMYDYIEYYLKNQTVEKLSGYLSYIDIKDSSTILETTDNASKLIQLLYNYASGFKFSQPRYNTFPQMIRMIIDLDQLIGIQIIEFPSTGYTSLGDTLKNNERIYDDTIKDHYRYGMLEILKNANFIFDNVTGVDVFMKRTKSNDEFTDKSGDHFIPLFVDFSGKFMKPETSKAVNELIEKQEYLEAIDKVYNFRRDNKDINNAVEINHRIHFIFHFSRLGLVLTTNPVHKAKLKPHLLRSTSDQNINDENRSRRSLFYLQNRTQNTPPKRAKSGFQIALSKDIIKANELKRTQKAEKPQAWAEQTTIHQENPPFQTALQTNKGPYNKDNPFPGWKPNQPPPPTQPKPANPPTQQLPEGDDDDANDDVNFDDDPEEYIPFGEEPDLPKDQGADNEEPNLLTNQVPQAMRLKFTPGILDTVKLNPREPKGAWENKDELKDKLSKRRERLNPEKTPENEENNMDDSLPDTNNYIGTKPTPNAPNLKAEGNPTTAALALPTDLNPTQNRMFEIAKGKNAMEIEDYSSDFDGGRRRKNVRRHTSKKGRKTRRHRRTNKKRPSSYRNNRRRSTKSRGKK